MYLVTDLLAVQSVRGMVYLVTDLGGYRGGGGLLVVEDFCCPHRLVKSHSKGVFVIGGHIQN